MGKSLFYIIRHGETEYNKLGIVQGSGVDMPLNELGRMQAQSFYNFYKDVPFDKIYTSALVRTQQSVMPFIAAGHSFEADAALNEISWGVFEGKPQSVSEREKYWRVVNAWNEGDYTAKIENGESANELQARQILFIEKLKNESHACVLIAMHGRALKSFLCTLLNEPLLNMEKYGHSNLCLYQLSFDGKLFELLKQKDIAHLEA